LSSQVSKASGAPFGQVVDGQVLINNEKSAVVYELQKASTSQVTLAFIPIYWAKFVFSHGLKLFAAQLFISVPPESSKSYKAVGVPTEVHVKSGP